MRLKLIDSGYKIKMVRHQDNRLKNLANNPVDLNDLYETDRQKFESYQGSQGRDVLNCDYFASFLGLENRRAKFVGFYKVKGKLSEQEYIKNHPTYYDFWVKIYKSASNYFYDFEIVNGFDDLIDRVIIDWGGGALSWAQNNIKKEVVEILPKGYVKEFQGYLELLLSYGELTKLIGNPESNRILHNRLTAVNGIYLITDRKTGGQYVGSAYGKNGIWGRWAIYSKDGHGGDKLLKELFDREGQEYKYNLNFSILQTLPSGLTNREVVAYEVLFKNKLGRKALILNDN